MGRSQPLPLSRSGGELTLASRAKRVAEVGASLVLLILAAPLLAVIAVLVRAGSHGPVLHRDAVAGRHGHTVELLSFRTMVDGGGTEAHARTRAVVGRRSAYTPIGRQLKRLRLDRLPRLVNVLKGEASLL